MEETEVDAALSALDRQLGSVRRYQGIVRVRGRGPDGGFDARLVVIFERPDALRVELLGAFAGTRWSAVAGAERIRAYFPSRRQYLEEEDVQDVVGRLLGLRLNPAEVMSVLAGVGAPLGPATRAAGERRGSLAILSLEGSETARIELDSDGQVVRAAGPAYRVSYPTRWKRRGRHFPDELVLENDSIRVVLTTEDVDVNVALDPEAFVLEIPEDAQRLRPAEVDGEAVFVIAADPRQG
jgi:hypothetical protein